MTYFFLLHVLIIILNCLGLILLVLYQNIKETTMEKLGKVNPKSKINKIIGGEIVWESDKSLEFLMFVPIVLSILQVMHGSVYICKLFSKQKPLFCFTTIYSTFTLIRISLTYILMKNFFEIVNISFFCLTSETLFQD